MCIFAIVNRKSRFTYIRFVCKKSMCLVDLKSGKFLLTTGFCIELISATGVDSPMYIRCRVFPEPQVSISRDFTPFFM